MCHKIQYKFSLEKVGALTIWGLWKGSRPTIMVKNVGGIGVDTIFKFGWPTTLS